MWKEQLETVLTRARIALGRCKIMTRTVGFGSIKHLVNLFDATVSSIFRYGLGVWGVSCGQNRQITKLDDLFVEYIRWVFRLPCKTGKFAILGNIARTCGKCDSIFLASVQLAQSRGSRNKTWKQIVEDLEGGFKSSAWFDIVRAEVQKRGLLHDVFEASLDFVSKRKEYGAVFAQYCYHSHCNVPTGSSADLLRRKRKFGIFPFIFFTRPSESRFLLSFLDRVGVIWTPVYVFCTQGSANCVIRKTLLFMYCLSVFFFPKFATNLKLRLRFVLKSRRSRGMM